MKNVSNTVEKNNKRGKYMKGSRIADEIIADMKREEFFKQRAIRNRCIKNKEKKCNECHYRNICKDKEETI